MVRTVRTERIAGGAAGRVAASWLPVALCALGFLADYLIAVCTPLGQRAENALIHGDGARPAWIYSWSGTAYGSSAMPPLDYTAEPTLVVGLVVIVAVALVRRCWWRGCAAVGVVAATLGGKEVIRMLLPRPDLVGARISLTEASFPSGHVAIPAALTLGAAIVAPARFRPYVTAVGMLWLAVTAGAVQATYQHRPSDVLGATLLACACYCLAVRLLPSDTPAVTARPRVPAVIRRPRAATVAALAVSAVGAFVAGTREDSVTQSTAFAAAAFLCAGLVWCSTTQRARSGPPALAAVSPAPSAEPAAAER